jgi:hypothetical protein
VKRTGFKPRGKPFSAKARKPIKPKSTKRATQHASQQGKDDLAYMGRVKEMDCAACGRHGPSDAHHCKDKPPFDERDIYQRLPIGCKSGPQDTIPLCKDCHQGANGYHTSPKLWNERHGPDYGFLTFVRDWCN